VAATGDFTLMEELAASGDRDRGWLATKNLKNARLRRARTGGAIRQLLD
jgi:hypothetical protein